MQLLFSDMHDTIEAKFIRHRAKAWFLPPGEPLPKMRCGQGPFRWVGGGGGGGGLL